MVNIGLSGSKNGLRFRHLSHWINMSRTSEAFIIGLFIIAVVSKKVFPSGQRFFVDLIATRCLTNSICILDLASAFGPLFRSIATKFVQRSYLSVAFTPF